MRRIHVISKQLASTSPVSQKAQSNSFSALVLRNVDPLPSLRPPTETSLKGKTVLITGASRGIGLEIGKRVARDGANVVIAAKTAEPHPKLPGTIYTAAKEIEDAGGHCLPVICDIRNEADVESVVKQAVEKFGGIDILVNNASAINLSSTVDTAMKRFDLMHSVNTRGTFMVSQKCIPILQKAKNPHILNLCPPLTMDSKWFRNHVAYTIAKYGMSMCVLGMSAELKKQKIAVNGLWPRTVIATAAVQNLLGGDEMMSHSRTPEIIGDAAYEIFISNSSQCTGNFFIDDEVLMSRGITDLTRYNVDPSLPQHELYPDFFL